jgi:hypothetical protein
MQAESLRLYHLVCILLIWKTQESRDPEVRMTACGGCFMQDRIGSKNWIITGATPEDQTV